MPKTVSIIIRTKNEERWISSCLHSVFSQDFKDFEVILVDNMSTDKTVAKAEHFGVKVLKIEDFLPGKALNLGIRNSTGKYICCLSGHCIPTNRHWLSNLLKNIKLPKVAGVYGRQEPLAFTSDVDKRDLIIAFGLDRKVQTRDPFFHNANSIVRRELWEQYPFDEQITNIEDRIWASAMLRQGYKLVYEPEASVYHHHGIHQGLDTDRCTNIVRILESLDLKDNIEKIDPKKLNTTCIIPIKGKMPILGGRPLIEYTLKRVMESRYVKHVVLTSDNPDALKLAKDSNRLIALKRPKDLSMDFIEIEDILKFTMEELERKNIMPDIVLYMSMTYPFRPKGLIDNAVKLLIDKGFDSVIPTIREYRSCWRDDGGGLTRIDEGFIPSAYKHPVHIGISGLLTATHAEFVRRGERLGPRVGAIEMDDIHYSLDVGKNHTFDLAEKIIGNWWEKNS